MLSTWERRQSVFTRVDRGRRWLRRNTSLWLPDSFRNDLHSKVFSVEALERRRLLSGAAPTNLSATSVSTSEIDLSWQNNDPNANGIEIDRSTDGINFSPVTTVDTSQGEFQDVGLSDATHYWYNVIALDDSGNSDPATTDQWTQVNAPSNLSATIPMSGEVDLTWTNDSANANQFIVYRSTDGTNFSYIGSTDGSTTYQDTMAGSSGEDWYEVVASVYEGPSSDPATIAVPLVESPVTNLSATAASDSEIDLSWTPNSDSSASVELDRSTDGANFSEVALLNSGTDSYPDTGLSPSTHYWYQIEEIGFLGTSTAAAADTWTQASPPPPPPPTEPQPSNLIAATASASEIDLTWTNNDSGVDATDIYRSTDGTNYSFLGSVSGSDDGFSDTSVSQGTHYWYEISSDGTYGWSAPVEADVTAQPMNLSATAVSNSEIDLSWQEGGVSSGLEYAEVSVSDDGVNYYPTATINAGVGSYQDTLLQDGSHYWYQVTLCSGIPLATGYADSYTIPLAPSNLTVTPLGASEISISCQDNSSNASVEIDRSTDGINFSPVGAIGTGDLGTFTDSGLSEGTHYWYRAEAVVPGDASASITADAWTELLAPSALSATPVSSSEIDLTWTNQTSVGTGIDVFCSFDGSNYGLVATLNSTQSYYDDTGLPSGYHYWFELVAVSSNSFSAPTFTDAGLLPGPNTVTTLAPTADAYVRSYPYDAMNYGSDDDLQVDSSSSGDYRESYLTFDLSSIKGNILDVQLRLYGGLSTASSVYTTADIVPIASSWSESSINADNAPLDAGTPVASTTVTSNVAQWYDWDLTGYIENQLSSGVTQISIGVEGDTPTDGPAADFHSREASTDGPQLVITTDVVTFSPTADSYTQDGAYADTTFGGSSELNANASSTTGDNRVIYLTFDTSSDANSISTAVVALYGSVQGSEDTNVAITAYPVSDTTWSQNSITWNNAPTIDTSTPLSATVVTNSTPALYTLDITNYLLQQRAIGIDTVSIALVCTGDSTNGISFASTNSSSNAPFLWTTASSMPVQYAVTSTQAQLTWESVIGAASYSIYRSDTSGDIGDLVASGLTGTTYTDTTVPSGQTSYYTIVPLNGAGADIVLPTNDYAGTNSGGYYASGGSAGISGGGPQIPILPPPDNEQITLGADFAQPNFEEVSSGGEFVSSSNSVPSILAVKQFDPRWGTLLEVAATNLSYNYEWNCDGTGWWGSGANMYYSPMPSYINPVDPNPPWTLVAQASAVGPATLRGNGDVDPGLPVPAPGYGLETIRVISNAWAGACGLTADTPCDAVVSGMWTGFYSITYDYIPTY